jgi:hypothetical protein
MLAGRCLSNGKEQSDVKLSQPGEKLSFDFQSFQLAKVNECKAYLQIFSKLNGSYC